MSPSTRKSRIADAVHQAFLGVAGLILLLMAGIILTGVVARYILDSPLPGITELIGEGLMVALIYLSLSSAHHIRVSLVITRLPDKVRKFVDFGVVGLCAGVLLLGVVPAAQKAMGAYRSGEATTGLVTFAIWPYRVIVVVGIALTAIRALERGRRWLQADETGMRREDDPAVSVVGDDASDEQAAPGDERG